MKSANLRQHLRQVIRESLSESKLYSDKCNKLKQALTILETVLEQEVDTAHAEDEELVEIILRLSALVDAVEAMAAM